MSAFKRFLQLAGYIFSRDAVVSNGPTHYYDIPLESTEARKAAYRARYPTILATWEAENCDNLKPCPRNIERYPAEGVKK